VKIKKENAGLNWKQPTETANRNRQQAMDKVATNSTTTEFVLTRYHFGGSKKAAVFFR